MGVRVVEAYFENGALRPSEHLGLRSGERVKIIVVRRPDPGRWDMTRFAKVANTEDIALAEQGLGDWASSLEDGEHN
jgi:predicted DNA-binding antitoxin AbrB/MazE fold protein